MAEIDKLLKVIRIWILGSRLRFFWPLTIDSWIVMVLRRSFVDSSHVKGSIALGIQHCINGTSLSFEDDDSHIMNYHRGAETWGSLYSCVHFLFFIFLYSSLMSSSLSPFFLHKWNIRKSFRSRVFHYETFVWQGLKSNVPQCEYFGHERPQGKQVLTDPFEFWRPKRKINSRKICFFLCRS